MKQREEVQCDLVDDILVSRVDMARDDDHISFTSQLCAFISKFWTGGVRVQAHTTPSVRVRSARKAARGAIERRVVRGSADCGSSTSSASEGSGQGEELRSSKSVRRER